MVFIMVFIGSNRFDSAKRFTIGKDVADTLQVAEGDHLLFFIEGGEVIVRKALPGMGTPDYYVQEKADKERKLSIEASMQSVVDSVC